MKNLKIKCKRRSKIHLWKIVALLFGLFFMVTNCNHDTDTMLENDNLNSLHKPIAVEQVLIDDIPTIINSIKGLSYQAKGLSNQKETRIFILIQIELLKQPILLET